MIARVLKIMKELDVDNITLDQVKEEYNTGVRVLKQQ